MTYVDRIVETFGGVRPMAAAIGRKPSTVMSWKVRGSIPDAHKLTVLAAAQQQGLPISKGDFFPSAVVVVQ